MNKNLEVFLQLLQKEDIKNEILNFVKEEASEFYKNASLNDYCTKAFCIDLEGNIYCDNSLGNNITMDEYNGEKIRISVELDGANLRFDPYDYLESEEIDQFSEYCKNLDVEYWEEEEFEDGEIPSEYSNNDILDWNEEVYNRCIQEIADFQSDEAEREIEIKIEELITSLKELED